MRYFILYVDYILAIATKKWVMADAACKVSVIFLNVASMRCWKCTMFFGLSSLPWDPAYLPPRAPRTLSLTYRNGLLTRREARICTNLTPGPHAGSARAPSL